MPKARDLVSKTAFRPVSGRRGRCAETCGRICGCRLLRSSFLLPPLRFSLIGWERRAATNFRGCHILESRTLSDSGSRKEIPPHVESQDETHQGKKENAEKLCRRVEFELRQSAKGPTHLLRG